MPKKIIIPTILFIAVLAFSFFAFSGESGKNKPAVNEPTKNEGQTTGQIILFYGDGCPHCKIVDEYIEKNNIKNILAFTEKEVYYNQANAKELEAKAKLCGLPTDSIGVPFLFDGEKCFIGDLEIKNFFKQKTNGQ